MPRAHRTPLFASSLIAACVAGIWAGDARAQLRVAQWNVTNYNGGRVAQFQESMYGVFEGRTMAPDVLIGQEFLSQAGVDAFLSLLNSAAGSPGDWAAAPFFNGPDTDNAFFYRTSRVEFLGVTTISFGGGSPLPPRNTERYDVRLLGYASEGATLSCYSTHMKAGTAGDDQARRLVEAMRIRDDAETLPAGRMFLVSGDFNIQTSSQSAYQEMIGSQANNDGRFFDPIRTPGSWNNSAAYRFVHTQDPSGAGGMDDRHDQILVCADLLDFDGFDYLGDSTIGYSTTTWDDPNHSYRAWGNDGTSYNTTLTVAGNTMVGDSIALAIIGTTSGQGHIPVFMDLLVPPVVGGDDLVDFGTLAVGELGEAQIEIENAGDIARWGVPGIAVLTYSLSADAPFSAPAGAFGHEAGDVPNLHTLSVDTSVAGDFVGTLTIASNDPDRPERVVRLIASVVAACRADLTGSDDPNSPAYGVPDGVVDAADFFYYLDQFASGNTAVADLTGSGDPNDPEYGVPDGVIDGDDFFFFLDLFSQGCD